jgi:hypothetical protein
MQALIAQRQTVTGRINARLRNAERVLHQGEQDGYRYIVLDPKGEAADVIELIQYDPDEHAIYRQFATQDTSGGLIGSVLDALLDLIASLLGIGSDHPDTTLMARHVHGLQFTLDEAPTETSLVNYRVQLRRNGLAEMVIGAARVRP